MALRTQDDIRILAWLVVFQLVLAGLVLFVGWKQNLDTSLKPPVGPTFSVDFGPEPPWLEVYLDGVLTSEWRPADGEIYWVLRKMVDQEEMLLARRAGL